MGQIYLCLAYLRCLHRPQCRNINLFPLLHSGVNASVNLYSLIETSKANGLEPLTLTGANNQRLSQTKTAPEGAAVDLTLEGYAFLRLAAPNRPDPNSHAAAGTGTADVARQPSPQTMEVAPTVT
jgi:hypothetical protein